ncbi:unnamed protein product [Amoebophrya sp. A120]|nr:unnamed protein product [Amoebophrya sp. A120]|eukprot:GSA120T00004296001.1
MIMNEVGLRNFLAMTNVWDGANWSHMPSKYRASSSRDFYQQIAMALKKEQDEESGDEGYESDGTALEFKVQDLQKTTVKEETRCWHSLVDSDSEAEKSATPRNVMAAGPSSMFGEASASSGDRSFAAPVAEQLETRNKQTMPAETAGGPRPLALAAAIAAGGSPSSPQEKELLEHNQPAFVPVPVPMTNVFTPGALFNSWYQTAMAHEGQTRSFVPIVQLQRDPVSNQYSFRHITVGVQGSANRPIAFAIQDDLDAVLQTPYDSATFVSYNGVRIDRNNSGRVPFWWGLPQQHGGHGMTATLQAVGPKERGLFCEELWLKPLPVFPPVWVPVCLPATPEGETGHISRDQMRTAVCNLLPPAIVGPLETGKAAVIAALPPALPCPAPQPLQQQLQESPFSCPPEPV